MTNIIKPYLSTCAYLYARWLGNRLTAILPPSRGGKGIKLRNISAKFISTPALHINSVNNFIPSGRLALWPNKIAQKIAIIKFDKGPAAATQTYLFWGDVNS